MNNDNIGLDALFSDNNFDLFGTPSQDTWDPGFDAERRLVLTQLGPYQKLFVRPQKFTPRFYHTVYHLPVEEWSLVIETVLYGGFCTVNTNVSIHFQVTFNYAQRNLEALNNLNQQVKDSYQGLILDIVDGELRGGAKDGDWILTGMAPMERKIEDLINETLLLRHIQCRTLCALRPEFKQLPDNQAELDGNFAQEAVYLNVLKKNFEFREKHNQELFRQNEELENQRLQHKQKQLEKMQQDDAIERQQLALQAENARHLLEEQERQLAEEYEIKSRLHAQKVAHEKKLRELEQEAELQTVLNQQPKQHELEWQMLANKIQHNNRLKEQELEAEIRLNTLQQTKWHEAKAQLLHDKIQQEERLKQQELEAELREQETYQREKQKIQQQLEAEKIQHQTKLKEMQLEAERKELELLAEASKHKESYLHREIEWLVLDKQRAELARAIRDTKMNE
jgi:hypothetical protein